MKTTTQMINAAISEMYKGMVLDLIEEARNNGVLPDRKFTVRFGTTRSAKYLAYLEYTNLIGLADKNVSEFKFAVNATAHHNAKLVGQGMAERISILALHEVGHFIQDLKYHIIGMEVPIHGDIHGKDWKQALTDLGYGGFDERTYRPGYATYEHSPGYSPRRWHMHYNKSEWVKGYAEKYIASDGAKMARKEYEANQG